MSTGTGPRELTILGDPTRARIVRLIRDSPDGRALVGRLADTLGLRQPTVSHHMKALAADGIVLRHPEGRRRLVLAGPTQRRPRRCPPGRRPPDRKRNWICRESSRILPSDIAARSARRPSNATSRRATSFCRRTIATPLLGSRTAAFATLRLDALARSEATHHAVPEVLFVCVENAGRSQLAAGILRQLAGDRVLVRTAGSAPADAVRATIVTALDEIGVPLGGEFPKPLTDEAVRAADVVVTMGCGDACPVYPGRRYLDWDIEDPVGKPLAVIRGIRDDIEARVRALLTELLSG